MKLVKEFPQTINPYIPLLDHIPVILFSPHGRILQLNEAAGAVLGIPSDRLLGHTFSEAGCIVVNERRNRIPLDKQPWIRAIQTRKLVSDKITGLRLPGGMYRWHQSTSLPLPDDGTGHTRAAISVLTDITKSKQTEEQLAIELRYERALAACATQILCASNFCGNCTAMKQLLQIPLKWITSVSCVQVFENHHDPDAGLCARCTYDISQRGLKRHRLHVQPMVWKDGFSLWLKRLSENESFLVTDESTDIAEADMLAKLCTSSLAVFPLFGGTKWLGFIAYADYREKHPWSDQDLRLLKLTAEIVGGMLGRKMVQEQLLQSQKMETIGSLSGGLAHDFNNILTGIRASIQLLLLDIDKHDRSYDDLCAIQQEIQRASDLVRQLLVFSKPSHAHPKPVNFNEQIRQMFKLFCRTIPKNIDIELNLSEQEVIAHIDPAQFEQVLLNLVLNARDAMPDGGRLQINSSVIEWNDFNTSPVPNAKPGAYACFTVTDHGTGIPPEALLRIFEPFYTTKKRGKGAGLGLSVVQAIILQHHGYVHVESQIDKGTTVFCYLPAQRMTKNRKVLAEDKEDVKGGPETILLVDDQQSVLKFSARFLERYGYSVLKAESGMVALDLYRRHKDTVSLVLLDFAMPGMSGRQCMEELHRMDPSLSVVMMSGYVMEPGEWHPLQGGASAFLQKPFDIRYALKVIRQVLDSKPSPSRLPDREPAPGGPAVP